MAIQPQTTGSNSGSSNDDLLAELREKTARLAAQVRSGQEAKSPTVLRIDPTPTEDQDVIDALMVSDQPSSADTLEKETPAPTNPAVEMIRTKLEKLYGNEPDAKKEEEEVAVIRHRSKHQDFMYRLSTSGKPLAEIQTEWHHYYISLPDDEKHQVWQEFYENQATTSKHHQAVHKQSDNTHKKRPPMLPVVQKSKQLFPLKSDPRSVTDIKNQLVDKITAGGTLKPVHHFKSLLFGLGMASLVGLIMTFTFFNEIIIAPFISPARAITTTPIIGDGTGEVGPEPKIIIPKINLEVPVVYTMNSIAENDVQKALEEGVVHYANTPNPGEQGNAVIVGHSSNNILNSGKYKFAFVLLKRLEAEDTFFLHKDGVRYTYKVYEKKIVGPEDVSVLDTQSRANTVTLITCDPPGTSVNRLIIVAEQISPDPANNSVSTATITEDEPAVLPSNAPSLWSRIWPF